MEKEGRLIYAGQALDGIALGNKTVYKYL